MVGEWRRRRRRRVVMRNLAGAVVAAAAAIVVVIIIVASLSQIGPTSGPYRRAVDRSYAALAVPLVDRSNASGVALAALFSQGPGLSRRSFFSALASLASDTSEVSRQFDALSPPGPVGRAGTQCAATFHVRAGAAASIGGALEGLLGGPRGTGGGDEAAATDAVASAASQLVTADATWARCRQELRRDPGSARLPTSVWMTDPGAWTTTTIEGFVAATVASPSLAAVHGLSIVATSTVPTAVAGSNGAGVVAPTHRVTVHVVVQDNGNVAEDGVEVTAVTARPGASSSTSQARTNLAAGATAGLSLPVLAVRPGASYTVEVTATVPGTTGPGTSATASFAIAVSAEPVVPTTTTTTTTVPPKKAAAGRQWGARRGAYELGVTVAVGSRKEWA